MGMHGRDEFPAKSLECNPHSVGRQEPARAEALGAEPTPKKVPAVAFPFCVPWKVMGVNGRPKHSRDPLSCVSPISSMVPERVCGNRQIFGILHSHTTYSKYILCCTQGEKRNPLESSFEMMPSVETCRDSESIPGKISRFCISTGVVHSTSGKL